MPQHKELLQHFAGNCISRLAEQKKGEEVSHHCCLCIDLQSTSYLRRLVVNSRLMWEWLAVCPLFVVKLFRLLMRMLPPNGGGCLLMETLCRCHDAVNLCSLAGWFYVHLLEQTWHFHSCDHMMCSQLPIQWCVLDLQALQTCTVVFRWCGLHLLCAICLQ